ncbi:MAG: pilus assembly protein TadG-related protein [Actinomycetota bacterium]|nr:pilus assembly protein TadG-related protein [Actinomycetota bacterium]
MNRTRGKGEEGQVYLVLLTFIVFLMAGGGMIAKYAGQDEVSSEAQTASDAAALAGAQVAVSSVLDALLNDTPELELGCDIGRSAASDYAQRNGATLSSYCYDFNTGTARAEVEVDKPVSGEQEVQVSSARLRALPVCKDKVPEETEPPPTDEPTNPPADDEPEPPATECSILGDVFEPGDDLSLGDLKDLLEPHLVPST